ncbi:MAG: hypothetical protein FWE45_02270 [Firmicutes bacterium]|nr:hypothetical protein [Bacillota bacterium]
MSYNPSERNEFIDPEKYTAMEKVCAVLENIETRPFRKLSELTGVESLVASRFLGYRAEAMKQAEDKRCNYSEPIRQGLVPTRNTAERYEKET